MSIGDFLFEGNPPPATQTLQESNQQLPEWWQEYTKGLLAKSSSIAGQGYQPYGGPRSADFTQDQQSGFQAVRDSQGIQHPYNDAAGSMITGAGNPSLDSGVFNSYMSPYTSGVVDQIARLGGRNLTENLLPGVNDTFTKAGQFGSSRNAEFTSRAIRDTNQDILNTQAGALESGFNNAQQAYGQGQYRSLMAGQQMGALGQVAQGEALKGAAALDATGQEQQSLNQKSLDLAHQDFVDQRDWDKNQAGFMSQMIRGLPSPGSSTSTSSLGPAQSYSASPLAQIAGVGLGAASLAKAVAKGGRVARRRGGALDMICKAA